MNLTAYNLNTQYQKTELKYETKITQMPNEEFKFEKNENEEEIDSSIINTPVIYANYVDLSNIDKFRKILMEKILGGFNPNNSIEKLIPNENIDISKKTFNHDNPYIQNGNSMPQSFLYSQSSEYYEKTTIEFQAQATIKTPNGTYNIELNFSYTKEFYEKNETQIAVANEHFKKSFEIELDKDDESLKGLKSLHFIFDILDEKKESNVDIFKEIKELLKQRREATIEMFKENKYKEENEALEQIELDNFQIWQENSNHEMNLITAKKDGIAIFLANSNSESSLINLNLDKNGYSLESSYSRSQTSYSRVTEEIKA